MLPARAGSTFLRTNSEQSAFKISLFGALKASNEHSLGHLFGSYRSQTFFFVTFPLQSPIRILKNRRQTCGFCTGSRPAKRHHLSHLQFCNFLMAGAFCCLLLMAIHTIFCKNDVMFCRAFRIFTKICSPLEQEAHF